MINNKIFVEEILFTFKISCDLLIQPEMHAEIQYIIAIECFLELLIVIYWINLNQDEPYFG